MTAYFMFLKNSFFMSDIDGDDARYRARYGQGDKVYPTEFHVFKAAQRREDEKSEQHEYKSRDRAFEQAVFRRLEAYETAEQYGNYFDGYIYGHNYIRGQGGKLDNYGKNEDEPQRYERRKQYGFQDIGDISFEICGSFHTKDYEFDGAIIPRKQKIGACVA